MGATSPNRRKAQLRRAMRLAINLSLAVSLVIGSIWVWERIRADERFTVTEIEVQAPDRLDARASAIIESYRGWNLFRIDLVEVSSRLESIDWVARASVEKIVPRKLRVRIVSREPAATVIRQQREMWVDDEGMVFSPVADARSDHLPRIDTPTRARTRDALAFLRSLERRDPELASRIARLTPLAHRQWLIEERELGTRVIADERDIVEKWQSFYGIAEHERWERGSIEYADLRFDRQIVVQRFGNVKQMEERH